MQSVYLERIMKKIRLRAMKKQTQNKPNPSGLRCLLRSPSMRPVRCQTEHRMTHCRTDQSQGIKRVRSIFRRFIVAYLAQAQHINIATPIFNPTTRIRPLKPEKNLENPQLCVILVLNFIDASCLFYRKAGPFSITFFPVPSEVQIVRIYFFAFFAFLGFFGSLGFFSFLAFGAFGAFLGLGFLGG